MRKVLRKCFLQKSYASLNASNFFFLFSYISGYLKIHFLSLLSLFYDVLTWNTSFLPGLLVISTALEVRAAHWEQ